ncbi:hypothetical protein SOVF_175730, partial [Spinacia oleracea]
MVEGVSGDKADGQEKVGQKEQKPEEKDPYGAWMLVQRPARRPNTRTKVAQGKNPEHREVGTKTAPSKAQQQPNQASQAQHADKARSNDKNLEGSRFAVLREVDMEVEAEAPEEAQYTVKDLSGNLERNRTRIIPNSQTPQLEVVDEQAENVSLENSIIKERQIIVQDEIMDEISSVDLAASGNPSFNGNRIYRNRSEDIQSK